MRRAVIILGLAVLWACPALAADTVPARLDAARAAHAKGDLARAALELEAAVAELQARLGKQLADFLPPPPAGWQAEAVETHSLAGTGGGLAVTRAYGRDDATLNISLIIDSPAVSAAVAQLAAFPQPNHRKVKVGTEEATMRWDSQGRNGEVLMVLGPRVLLQIEGDSLANSDILADVAKGWNLGGIRKTIMW
ncbi:conserved exported protein of unknown function [Magnetospirillum sp. XM-1]|uniref:hypothetical protein n=1 Tax=Magnetospirillum sp. XM-1 TaxID=1663591 RepID=UPI00073DE874|nr:hypothetical protein [Magnetospirillum sp. XM-1]CUW39003.1 conserved exported protein of unknown function [Magnetospirillum sp. XM-1]